MAREAAREWGKKGGRPRTAPHVEGWKGCRCAGCREKKVKGAQVDVKVGPAAGEGAQVETIQLTRAPNMETEPIDLGGILGAPNPRRMNGVEENAVTVSGPYRGIGREGAVPLSLSEEIRITFDRVMRENPEADPAVIRPKVTEQVKQLRRERALEAEAAAPVVVPKSLEALKEMFGLKPAVEVK